MAEIVAPLLIFGGCCSNVYALEAILLHEPSSGLLITLTHFVFVTFLVYPSQSGGNGFFLLKRPQIPWPSLLSSAAMFFAVNMLNNWAFAFNISVPVHMILRMFGAVTTIGAGYLNGKRYSRVQVISVVLLTIGIVISALADAQNKGKDLGGETDIRGLLVLLVAQLLSSAMGIFTQNMFAQYGKHWQENLFYSHLLSIPMVLPLHSILRAQYQHLLMSPPIPLSAFATLGLSTRTERILVQLLSYTPSSIVYLVWNGMAQCICITGVNLLSAQSSAVTVTIVLNLRKLLSLMLSIWLFGNTLSPMMLLGATIAFGSGALYGWESAIRRTPEKAIKKRTEPRNCICNEFENHRTQ